MAFHCNPDIIDACVAEYKDGSTKNNGACESLYDKHAKHYEKEPLKEGSRRFHRFVENVRLVQEHNQRSDVNHQITLNQFSDLYDHELPLAPMTNLEIDSNADFVHLTNHDSILNAANGRRRLKKKKHHHHHHQKVTVEVDPKDKWSTIDTAIDDHLEGRQVQISARHKVGNLIRDPEFTILNEDSYETHLNWATGDNPDGVPIVHPPTDQGTCGSCWAFAATGTLEASASRRVAYESYKSYLQDAATDVKDAEYQAELVAQRAEQAAIGVANLSVQELIDCDTAIDQGCTGGNPLLAFYFIHRYGLVATDEYPYVGQQDMCKVRRVANPIATAQSWGILSANHEDNMEMVLRWIGPIAVGVNGSDQTFLAYKRGIFDSAGCGQGANHAMLIVGYGQEEDMEGNMVRYWIARNSWGETWGEDGYVRVKRGSGIKDEAGVCGIAKNPSVALGGVLLPNSGIESASTHHSDEFSDRSTRLEESLLTNYCDALGLGDLQTCNRIEGLIKVYPALIYGAVSVFLVGLFVVWPLTRECRQRRRRRELRRTLMLDTQQDSAGLRGEGEELLPERSVAYSYGTNSIDDKA